MRHFSIGNQIRQQEVTAGFVIPFTTPNGAVCICGYAVRDGHYGNKICLCERQIKVWLCNMAFSDGGGEYSDVHTIIRCAEHSMPESALTQRDDMRQVREQLEEAEKQVERINDVVKRLAHSLRNAEGRTAGLHGAAANWAVKGLKSVWRCIAMSNNKLTDGKIAEILAR